MLAKESGISRNEATRFAETLQALFEEALIQDKILKINNIGTFKIEYTKPRRSVDINTGEAIEIASHNRITFSPSATLANAVNAELAHLTTYNLDNQEEEAPVRQETYDDVAHTAWNPMHGPTNDKMEPDAETPLADSNPLKKLTEDAIGLRGLLDEIQNIDEQYRQQRKAETEREAETVSVAGHEHTTSETEQGNTISGTEETDTPENAKDTDMTNDTQQEASDTNHTSPATPSFTVQTDSIDGAAAVAAVNRENSTEIGGSKAVWISVAVILALLTTGIVLWQNMDFFDKTMPPATEMAAASPTRTTEDAMQHTPQAILTTDTTESGQTHDDEMSDPEEMSPEMPMDDSMPIDKQGQTAETTATASHGFAERYNRTRDYTTFTDTVTITSGSRLTLISLKYYGNKDFWVYIYEANRDIISNPNNIRTGTRIRIPELPDFLTNQNDEECMRYARFLTEQYIQNIHF